MAAAIPICQREWNCSQLFGRQMACLMSRIQAQQPIARLAKAPVNIFKSIRVGTFKTGVEFGCQDDDQECDEDGAAGEWVSGGKIAQSQVDSQIESEEGAVVEFEDAGEVVEAHKAGEEVHPQDIQDLGVEGQGAVVKHGAQPDQDCSRAIGQGIDPMGTHQVY